MQNQSPPIKKIPMSQKIAFGVGMLANQMFPAILGIFMVVLVQDLGFTGRMWSLIYFFPRIFDSITDPIMGFISDNTKSKWYSLCGDLCVFETHNIAYDHINNIFDFVYEDFELQGYESHSAISAPVAV